MDVPKKQKIIGKCYSCGKKGKFFHIYDVGIEWSCRRHLSYYGGKLPEPCWANSELQD